MMKPLVTFVASVALMACAHHDDPVSDPSSMTSPNQSPTLDAGAGVAPRVAANVAPKRTASSPGRAVGAPAPVPLATAVASTKPDDTGMNERDGTAQTLTPLSQGNSQAEITITASIRRRVIFDWSLGFSAKNVKIITVGTKVTLRGPVSSERERSTIEAIARQTHDVTEVDDQIEVTR